MADPYTQLGITLLVQQYRDRLERAWPEGPLDINQIEDLAGRGSQEVQRDLTEKLVREEAERKPENQTACPCGGSGRFRGRYALDLVTAAGPIRVRRAYYHCARCGCNRFSSAL